MLQLPKANTEIFQRSTAIQNRTGVRTRNGLSITAAFTTFEVQTGEKPTEERRRLNLARCKNKLQQVRFHRHIVYQAHMIQFLAAVAYCFVAAFFVAVRIPELSAVIATDITGTFVIALAILGCASLFSVPAKTTWLSIRRIALITLV
jgi:hypothetical protein